MILIFIQMVHHTNRHSSSGRQCTAHHGSNFECFGYHSTLKRIQIMGRAMRRFLLAHYAHNEDVHYIMGHFYLISLVFLYLRTILHLQTDDPHFQKKPDSRMHPSLEKII